MKYQFMPLFSGDFLANTMHLSAQEFGAYMLLVMHAWEHDAQIPIDGAQRIARVDNRHWRKVWLKLQGFFEPVVGHGGQATEVRHRRVVTELAKAAELSNKNREAALRMHSERKAKAHANHDASILQLPIESLTNGKGSEAPTVQAQRPPVPTPQPKPSLPPVKDCRDPGNDYRSPPTRKPDFPPLTEEERTAAMLLAAKGKL